MGIDFSLRPVRVGLKQTPDFRIVIDGLVTCPVSWCVRGRSVPADSAGMPCRLRCLLWASLRLPAGFCACVPSNICP